MTVTARLFDRLNQSGIQYVVLRGYLPSSELDLATEIDLLVGRGDRARLTALLEELGWHERRHQTGRYPHRFFDNYDVPGRVCTTLDVVDDLVYGAELRALPHPERVLATAEASSGVQVPHPWVALLTFGLHVCLDKGKLSEANARRGEGLWTVCRARGDGPALVERDFGAGARRLTTAFGELLEKGDEARFAALRTQAATLDILRSRPLLAHLDALRTRWRVRRMRPFRVAVLGMDGAGKSTIISHAAALPSSLAVGSAYLGENQFILPFFVWVGGKLESWKARYGASSLRARAFSKLRALLLPLELYARMRRAEWWRSIVLYDRYPFPAYEREHPPRTPGGRLVAAYERWWASALPAPDALLLCDGDPKVIWSRKQEYPFEAYLRAHELLTRLYDDFPGEKYLLRTDRPLAETLAEIPEILRASPTLRRRLSLLRTR